MRGLGKGGSPSAPRLPGSTATGRPGVSGPARPAKPQLPGRGAAAKPTPEIKPTRPNLTARGIGASAGAPTTGPRPSLGGRHDGPTPAEHRGEARPAVDETQEAWVYTEGNELWTIESEAVVSVEAPAEHRSQQQGKVLGQN